MKESNILDTPKMYPQLEAKCKEMGFTMPSDIYIGTLLKSLVASKPKSNILELGTGISLSLAWMIEGLDEQSRLTSIDNDPSLIEVAQAFFGEDERLDLVCADGAQWIKHYEGDKFDLIFADTWPGKYSELLETLKLVKVGGFYIIDDMTPQPNWPAGHEEKAIHLTKYLEERDDFTITKMNWSTGVILCTKRC
ncbi:MULTISPECIES: O-methyltransferase [Reichenbachiella]|uniref:Predicted O-methyltransferase YrrM n=1 Tax=Reichenbachiella agariperforans TaxID=156994 RepID=A0A1M6V132_REIAG|nr:MULTISPECIES: class I SAM-dependent methyltransferase [Reichenbachiella]MBU2912393.1 class I SAM-dependent methyltransferase [Reichenbachiella agariperforans]RJE72734.1 methyltransferase [Reichenbachiella sp. MSK19-1]SHK75114.1 Predicted O-methyltransferase YrrM [Reichenbachiella agariperforans]